MRVFIRQNMEHPGGLSAWKHQVKSGFLTGIDYIAIPAPANSEEEIVQLFEAALRIKPKGYYAIVSVSHVLATTGMMIPISRLKSLVHGHGALLIVDGAQSTGSVIRLNLAESGADAYTISGHKGLLGPPGSGFLYIRTTAKKHIQPGMLDDGYCGYEHSSGTAPFQTILGLGYSLDFIQAAGGLSAVAMHGQQLAAQTQEGVQRLSTTKFPGLKLLSPDYNNLASQGLFSSIVTVAMPPAINVKDVITNLKDEEGVRFVVKDLADHKGVGVPKIFSAALRVSYHMYNSQNDVERFLRALETALEKLECFAAVK
jgi:selenocysteine lyase/cysteine desulfurase